MWTFNEPSIGKIKVTYIYAKSEGRVNLEDKQLFFKILIFKIQD